MNCEACGKHLVAHRGNIQIEDPFVGRFVVRDVDYEVCPLCAERYFAPDVASKIHNTRIAKLDTLLQQMPISDFVSQTEAAELLGITKQALSKHRRINRGFIFNTLLSGKKVFLRQSIEKFKEDEDGRFALVFNVIAASKATAAKQNAPVSAAQNTEDASTSVSASSAKGANYVGAE